MDLLRCLRSAPRYQTGTQVVGSSILSRAALAHNELRSFLTDEEREVLGGPPVQRDDKEFLPLQAADMIAWQTRRYIGDNKSVTDMDKLIMNSQHLKELELVPTIYKTYRLERLRYLGKLFRSMKEVLSAR